MSDDIIKRLREAIAAGPTPGPWHHKEWGSQIVDDGVGSSQVLIAKVAVNTYRDQGRHNATYIAAASPDNIAALLGRLDAAERECERLRSESKAQLEELDRIDDALGTNEGPSAVDHIVILKTENERLRAVVSALAFQANRDPFVSVGHWCEHGPCAAIIRDISSPDAARREK